MNLPKRNRDLARIDERPDEGGTLALMDIDGLVGINSILGHNVCVFA
jgi:hypothetical protein